MTHSRPTMKHVAELAQVSVKTVSRVVNDERWVSAAVAERVHNAIDELGYRLDVRARAMRNSALAGRTIGVIHADLANSFFTGIHSGIEEIAGPAGWLIVTASSGDSVERQEALLQTFADRRVDGIIVIPAADSDFAGHDTDALAQEIQRGMPIVFVDRMHDEASDLVASDNFGGAIRATRHLIEHGHRHIAFLGDDERLYSAKRRVDGFMRAMAEANLPTPWVHMNISTEVRAHEAVRALLQQEHRPTALFTGKNHSSAGAVQALHELGVQRDVAMVGFDEVAMGNVIEPGITVIAQDAPELGRIAGEMLLERIIDGRTEPDRRIVEVRLIPRGSGEIGVNVRP